MGGVAFSTMGHKHEIKQAITAKCKALEDPSALEETPTLEVIQLFPILQQ